MDDPTRRMSGASGATPELSTPAADADRPGVEPAPPRKEFVGDAMRSLLSSADVSVSRGDATRVIGRSQPPAPQSPRAQPRPPAVSSAPPGPRVDVALWVVLAAGLFAIAGYMLSAAL